MYVYRISISVPVCAFVCSLNFHLLLQHNSIFSRAIIFAYNVYIYIYTCLRRCWCVRVYKESSVCKKSLRRGRVLLLVVEVVVMMMVVV